MMREDLKLIEPFLVQFICDDVKGCVSYIVADGATLKDYKAICILFCTHQNESGKPVLLSVIFPELEGTTEEGDAVVYDAKSAAEDFRKVLEEFKINIKTQVTCFCGDNVTFNDSLARELGLPHAFSLVVKNSINSFKLVKPLIITASGLIHAGGTNKRAAQVAAQLRSSAYNLIPSKLTYYNNPGRFASTVLCAQNRFANFPMVKKWHTQSTLAPVGDKDELEDDEGETPTTRWAAVEDAYKQPQAELVLAVVCDFYSTIPDLIVDTSAHDLFSVGENLLTRLKVLRGFLDNHKSEAHAMSLVNTARGADGRNLSSPLAQTDSEFGVFRGQIKNDVIHAAHAALKTFYKHVTPMIQTLEARFLFDPRNPPPVRAATELLQVPSAFGLVQTDSKWNSMLPSEYRVWQREWKAEVITSSADIINDWKSRLPKFPRLATVALWHLEIPTSSIPAKRTFAIMRTAYQSNREAMS